MWCVVMSLSAITMSITNFFTETQKHFGQRISELLVALKDLPVTRDIPVLSIPVLSVLVRTHTHT